MRGQSVWIHRAAIIGAFVILALSSLVPVLVLQSIKPIPVDTSRTVSTEPAQTKMYDAAAQCPEDAARNCYVVDTFSSLKRTLHTSASENKDEVNLEVVEKLARLESPTPDEAAAAGTGAAPPATTETAEPDEAAFDDAEALIEVEDSLRLIRHSTYPVVDNVSHLSLAAPTAGLDIQTGDFARGGLQYFFPFETERRSYQYFDVIAQQYAPLDYVGMEGETYVFTQTIPAVSLREAVTRSFTHPADLSDEPGAQAGASGLSESERSRVDALQVTGAASQFYAPGDNAPTGTVVLDPYYAATRTLWVEPKSGTIVNQVEDMFIFLAQNQDEANATVAAGGDDYRTLLQTSLAWDSATRETAWAQAHPVVAALNNLKLATFIARVCAVIVMVFGLVRFNRVRVRKA